MASQDTPNEEQQSAEAPATAGVRILIVDDEEAIRRPLKRYLEGKGCSVGTASTGSAALDSLRQEPAALMILDIRMPGMTGIEVLPAALEIDSDLAVVMLSGVNEAQIAAECMQRGAMDYLTKPIQFVELDDAIHRALRRRDTHKQDQGITDWLRREVQRRGEEVEVHRQRQEELTVATLTALINALEAKSDYFGGHSARVASLSATIAGHLDLDDETVEQVRTAGMLHDIGMIGVRDEVLNKAGQLTEQEFAHVKGHIAVGSQILEPFRHLAPVVALVRHHHERWDGSGYPSGLAGDEIPLGARIIAAADVFDAITSSRPHQKEMSQDEAAEYLGTLAGKALDPTVVETLGAAVAKRRTLTFVVDERGRDADRDPQPKQAPEAQ
jgi:response regulator RpfG family c-di-GMP phosphodiesterase